LQMQQIEQHAEQRKPPRRRLKLRHHVEVEVVMVEKVMLEVRELVEAGVKV